MDVVITVTRNEVTYAVDFETAKVAQMFSIGEDTGVKKKAVEMITDERHKDWLDRQVEDAVQVLRSYSSAYLEPRRTSVVKDRIDWSRDEWVISLRMPPGWRGSAESLVSSANRYVVSYVLGKWYRMVFPQRVAFYEDDCAHVLHNYVSILNDILVGTKYW